MVKGRTVKEINTIPEFADSKIDALLAAECGEVGVGTRVTLIAVAVLAGLVDLSDDEFVLEAPPGRPLVEDLGPGPHPWDELASYRMDATDDEAGASVGHEPDEQIVALIQNRCKQLPHDSGVGDRRWAFPQDLDALIDEHGPALVAAVRAGRLPVPDSLVRLVEMVSIQTRTEYQRSVLEDIAEGRDPTPLEGMYPDERVTVKRQVVVLKNRMRVRTNGAAALIAAWAGWI